VSRLSAADRCHPDFALRRPAFLQFAFARTLFAAPAPMANPLQLNGLRRILKKSEKTS